MVRGPGLQREGFLRAIMSSRFDVIAKEHGRIIKASDRLFVSRDDDLRKASMSHDTRHKFSLAGHNHHGNILILQVCYQRQPQIWIAAISPREHTGHAVPLVRLPWLPSVVHTPKLFLDPRNVPLALEGQAIMAKQKAIKLVKMTPPHESNNVTRSPRYMIQDAPKGR